MSTTDTQQVKTAYMPKSKSDDWETPDKVYEVIESEFGYQKDWLSDPCPLNSQFDALETSWGTVNFVNPPYSNITGFVRKALEETDKGKIVIMLLPSKTDQRWFHAIWQYHKRIHWFEGRLKFKGAKYHATQPHFLVEL